jgi:hypothetical protein
VFQLSSLWHRLIAKSQRTTMFSSKTPESAEGSGWPSVRTHFGLRQVHVVLPRRLVPQHDLTWICTCAHRIVLAAYDASRTTGSTFVRTHASSSCSL